MNIPILGSKFKLKSMLVSVTVECQQCEAKHTVLLVSNGAAGRCACGATYQLAALEYYLFEPEKTRVGISDTPSLQSQEGEARH